MTRAPAGSLGSTSTLRPETCGKRPARFGSCENAVLQRGAHVGAGELDHHRRIAERHLREDVAPGEPRARRVLLAGPDAAAVGDRDIGPGRRPDGVGDQVADRRLLRADRHRAAVERRRGGADLDVELLRERALVALHDREHLRVRIDGHRIVDAERRRPGDLPRRSFACHDRGEVDGGDEIALLVRFDHHGAAVVADGEIVVVPGQEHVDEPGSHDRVVALPVGVGRRRRGCRLPGAAAPPSRVRKVSSSGRNFRSPVWDMPGVAASAMPTSPILDGSEIEELRVSSCPAPACRRPGGCSRRSRGSAMRACA